MAERRRANGKTQTQVAALMHTSPAMVSRLESGHDVRVSTLEKYIAALGLRLELAEGTRAFGARNRATSATAGRWPFDAEATNPAHTR